jgi:hypothetical protein
VVVETSGPLTYVGRFDSEDQAGVHLIDVGIHDVGVDGSREEYVRRSARFGVRTDRKHLVVPSSEVYRVTPLGEVEG